MNILLAKIALLLTTIGSLFGFVDTPKLAGTPIKVEKYYYDNSDEQYFKVLKDGTKVEYPNYDFPIKQGEYKYGTPKKKVRELKENEYYLNGETNESSTTPKVLIKKDGVESVKLLNEIQ